MKKKWDLKTVKQEAKKYKRLSEFQKKSSGAYGWARKNSKLNLVTSHMLRSVAPKGFWTKDRIINECKKYASMSELRKNNSACFQAIYNKRMQDAAFKYLSRKKAPNGYWTRSKIIDEAKKFQTILDFRTAHPGAYSKALRLKMQKELNNILKAGKKPNGYWDYEKSFAVVERYSRLADFYEKEKGAYSWIKRNNYLNELGEKLKLSRINYTSYTKIEILKKAFECKNRKEFRVRFNKHYRAAESREMLGEIFKKLKIAKSCRDPRGIYVFEFPDRTAYVGITNNFRSRYYKHLSAHKIISNKTEELGHYFYMSPKMYDPFKAAILEESYIENYKTAGWKVINIAKAGALGGYSKKWTKNKIHIIAKKYKSFSEFRQKEPLAYKAAYKKGIINEVCRHMKRSRVVKGFWTMENIYKISKGYCSRAELFRKNRRAYIAASRKGLLSKLKFKLK